MAEWYGFIAAAIPSMSNLRKLSLYDLPLLMATELLKLATHNPSVESIDMPETNIDSEDTADFCPVLFTTAVNPECHITSLKVQGFDDTYPAIGSILRAKCTEMQSLAMVVVPWSFHILSDQNWPVLTDLDIIIKPERKETSISFESALVAMPALRTLAIRCDDSVNFGDYSQSFHLLSTLMLQTTPKMARDLLKAAPNVSRLSLKLLEDSEDESGQQDLDQELMAILSASEIASLTMLRISLSTFACLPLLINAIRGRCPILEELRVDLRVDSGQTAIFVCIFALRRDDIFTPPLTGAITIRLGSIRERPRSA